jgi:hypothetical protein
MAKLKPRHKREIKRAVQRIKLFLNKKRYHPRRNVLLDMVVFGLVSKAVRVAQAAVCLIDAGLAEEAFGLSRTLVEIALSLRFITNRYSERRARRFAFYAAKWKMQLMRRMLTLTSADGKPKHTKAELRKLIPDYKLMVKFARPFPKSPSAHWSQPRKGKQSNSRTLAFEADGHEKLNGKPVDWAFDYEWIYAWTSQYVHATAACMESHFTVPREVFRIHVAPDRNRGIDSTAVFNVALYLHKILKMAFTAIHEPFPEALSSPLEKILTEITNE